MQAFINQPLKESGISIDSRIDINTNRNMDANKDSLSLEIYNPKSIKKRVFNIRLNDYYLAALKQLAKPDEGISMQKIAREILERGLDALIAERKKAVET